MLLGASVGIVAAAGIGGVFHLAFPWLVNVALAKLTLVAAGGLMASGAVVRRVAARREQAAIYEIWTVTLERQHTSLSFFQFCNFAGAEISEISERIGIRDRALEVGS